MIGHQGQHFFPVHFRNSGLGKMLSHGVPKNGVNSGEASTRLRGHAGGVVATNQDGPGIKDCVAYQHAIADEYAVTD